MAFMEHIKRNITLWTNIKCAMHVTEIDVWLIHSIDTVHTQVCSILMVYYLDGAYNQITLRRDQHFNKC